MGKKLVIKNADFAENAIVQEKISITVSSNNDEYGTVTGGGKYLIGDTVVISAINNSGYHFASWDDGNTDNIRTIVVSRNKTSYIATFESGEAMDTYGDETLYEVVGGDAGITYAPRITVNTPALHTGQLKSIRMAFAEDVRVNILCGIIDQNGYFILNRRYEGVLIQGLKTETDLSAYNITVYNGEIVVVALASNEDTGIPYAYYAPLGGPDSNYYHVENDMSVVKRIDGIYQTFYYKIRY